MKFLKSKRFWLIVGFVLLAIASLFFSIKWQIAGTILSALGSIASLYAIIEALAKVKSLKDETHSIKVALDDKIGSMNLKETTEQINKNIQIIARIQGYINAREHEAAILLMEQLLVFLQSLSCNPTTEESVVEDLKKYNKQLKIDLNNVRIENSTPAGAGLKYNLLITHFTELENYLTLVSQQNHFKND